MEETASCIGGKAYKLSKDRTYTSPFAMGAREAGYMYNRGGKQDDITVIVSQIARS